MRHPVIVALCCLLALSAITFHSFYFREAEPTPTMSSRPKAVRSQALFKRGVARRRGTVRSVETSRAPEPKDAGAVFDLTTGEALTAAARAIVLLNQNSTAPPSGVTLPGIAPELAALPDVQIAAGKWKYVQIQVSSRSGASKRIVRSIQGLKFHANVYDRCVKRELAPHGWSGRVVGGGRIVLDEPHKKVTIYGYSKTFGRCGGCNEETARMISHVKAYNKYEIEWTDNGY